MKKMCVIGLGYIGLPTAATFANNNWNVIGVDVNPKAIEAINKGEIHIEELELKVLVNNAVLRNLLTAKFEAEEADCFIIAVPTPHNADNTANLDYVIDATKSILPFIKKGDVVIVESTIPPRTINDVIAPIFEEANWNVGEDVFLAHCPERVLPGRILRELVKSPPCVKDDSVYSRQLNARKPLPRNRNGFRHWSLCNYRNVQIFINFRDTGTIWELLGIRKRLMPFRIVRLLLAVPVRGVTGTLSKMTRGKSSTGNSSLPKNNIGC